MSSPLLRRKKSLDKQLMSIEEAVSYLKKHFKKLGYSSRRDFCKANKVSYATLNAILNWTPTTKSTLPVRKITIIFNAIGYNCQLIKTINFEISAIE